MREGISHRKRTNRLLDIGSHENRKVEASMKAHVINCHSPSRDSGFLSSWSYHL